MPSYTSRTWMRCAAPACRATACPHRTFEVLVCTIATPARRARRLVELDPATEYVLHLDAHSAAEFEPPAGARVRRLPLGARSSVGLAAHGSRPLGDLLRMSVAASRGNYDAFLFPSLVTYVPAL